MSDEQEKTPEAAVTLTGQLEVRYAKVEKPEPGFLISLINPIAAMHGFVTDEQMRGVIEWAQLQIPLLLNAAPASEVSD